MTMLTNMLAAVAAGVFGPKRAGDRRLADSKRVQLDQPSPPFSDPTRSADFSMMLWIWRFMASVGFVVLGVLLFWAIGSFGELGLSGKGLVALTPGFLFTAGLAIGLMALVFFSDRGGRDDETNRAAER